MKTVMSFVNWLMSLVVSPASKAVVSSPETSTPVSNQTSVVSEPQASVATVTPFEVPVAKRFTAPKIVLPHPTNWQKVIVRTPNSTGFRVMKLVRIAPDCWIDDGNITLRRPGHRNGAKIQIPHKDYMAAYATIPHLAAA